MLCLRRVSTIVVLFVMLGTNMLATQGINRFTALADESEEVPDLQGKDYATFKLSPAEWHKMELMKDVLQVRILFFISWFLKLKLDSRSQQRHNSPFHRTVIQLLTAPFLCLSAFGTHGKLWRTRISLAACQTPSAQVWRISISGIAPQMTLMYTLYALASTTPLTSLYLLIVLFFNSA